MTEQTTRELVEQLTDISIDDQLGDGAFGALCHWIDIDGDATRDQITDTFGKAFAAIDDRTADRIESSGEGWHILAATVRDGDY